MVDLFEAFPEYPLIFEDIQINLLKKYKFMTPKQNLKECVFNLMGIILYEDELFSNWNKNPLRTNQVYFAAAEIYLIIKLKEFLELN